MSFCDDVAATAEIQDCCNAGLQGIKGAERAKFQCSNPRDIEGSVDIDTCTERLYSRENRWDYAIGYQGKCYFIEIHPASTTEVSTMINKLQWLTTWLRDQSSPLLTNHAGFHWIASGNGNVSIAKGSPQARRLAASGITGPKKICGCRL